jgi:LysR family hydrogen peroxide-inducible transcriptional activator
MTLQQLEYIVAIENYGYFVEAAEACGVTQSTMSLMVKKLEEELDVRIFNRDTHPVTVTEIGRKVIDEAREVVYHSKQLVELTRSEKELSSGDLNIAMTTTVAPVLMAGMFKFMRLRYPALRLRTEEMITTTIIAKLKKAEIDMGILVSPVNDPDLLEIPLYKEKFFAYVSPENAMARQESLERDRVLDNPIWIMRDGVRLFDKSMLRPGETFTYEKMYEGGRVGILLQIANESGGITIIPETHIKFLPTSMQKCLKPIVNPVPKRTISLVIRNDYIHEQIMNIVIRSIKSIIPYELWDSVIMSEYLRL